MAGAIIRNPIPDWLKPENASVFDSYWKQIARKVGHLIGADDPAAQVMGVLGTEVPAAGAELLSLKAMAKRLAQWERAAPAAPVAPGTLTPLTTLAGERAAVDLTPHGDALLSQFGSTSRPDATSFILHDGTRIRGGGTTTHADLANTIGQHVDDLQLNGIVRNVHAHGIEVATPITEAQARIAVEDAKLGGYPLNVDVMGTGGSIKSKAFTRPSVDGVRNWIKAALP